MMRLFGHRLLGAPFTATSIIGFIALAGIIVRNSILLFDFIRTKRAQGVALRPALIEAGATRFKPIFLTAAAAMIGAAFILTDPIFQGSQSRWSSASPPRRRSRCSSSRRSMSGCGTTSGRGKQRPDTKRRRPR
jgi:multidrug efflux pump subunit AcrB